jgi:7-keto-8-aminopelargonate synthetase-like enzyme
VKSGTVPDTLPAPLQQVDRTYVRVNGRRLTYFAGCDYFRLASHPRVLRAFKEGLDLFGLSVSASRATTGNHDAYLALERDLAAFFGAEAALLTISGYMANLAVAQAVAGSFSAAFIDNQAHSSLWDAAQLLKCPVRPFRHRDPQDLTRRMARHPTPRPLLLTDGMFPHNGAVAPLKAYLATLPRKAMLLVDDAHAAGILGSTGKGTTELAGVPRRRVIQTVTLSKALGGFGGAILGSTSLSAQVASQSGIWSGSTPVPLPLACAARESLQILREDPEMRARLHRSAGTVREALRNAGVAVPDTPGPIISLRPRRPSDGLEIKRRLLRAGIHPPFIRYRSGPPAGYFRFAISSEHSERQLVSLAKVLMDSHLQLISI